LPSYLLATWPAFLSITLATLLLAAILLLSGDYS
jgi:hypothetical protein